jgi:DNA-binding NarL/FixJ family response regulator
MVNLALIEDNESILNTLIDFFELSEEIKVTASSTSIEEFLKSYPAETEMDVLLLDIMLPGMSGIQGIEPIKKRWPNVNILINSVLEDYNSIFSALQQGAVGYLTKETSLENIQSSIINAKMGMSVMNHNIAGRIVEYFSGNSNIKEKLSPKEKIIAEALKNGLSYKMIAFENNVSIDTIRFHIRNIYRKLEINSKGELIHLLLKNKE